MADGGILVDYVYSVVVVILRIRYNVLQVKYMLGQVVKLWFHSYIYSIAYCKTISVPFTWLVFVHWLTCLARLSLTTVLS